MKRVPYFAMCVLLLLVWVTMVSAGPNSSPATQKQQDQTQTSLQNDPIIPPKAGISWKEKVMMEREIQKRAAASRNALMRQAAIERQKDGAKAEHQSDPLDF